MVVGLLILFICLSPQAHRWVRVGNLSAIVGWLIGYAGLSIATNVQGARPAIAMVVGAVAKYVTLVLVPLHIAARHWRTIMWTGAIGLLFWAISFAFTGDTPYRIFANEIAPTLGRTLLRPQNVSLQAFLLRVQHVNNLPGAQQFAFQIARYGTLAVILLLLAARPGTHWRRPSNALSAAAALITWLLIFSPILWEHYISYLAPLWGWMIWEARAARGYRRWILIPSVTIALGLAWFPQKILPARFSYEPLNSFLLFSAILTLLIALRRMVVIEPAAGDSSAAVLIDRRS